MQSPFDPFFARSPVLKLLRSDFASFVLGFLFECFKEPGVSQISEEDLEVMLDERLRRLREEDASAPARDARSYLAQWCSDDYAYLRRFFSEEKASHVYQLTRHSEKALTWLEDLRQGERRGYATSESRFSRILGELRRLDRETNSDPEERITELLERRDSIDQELQQIRRTGEVATLEAAAVRDILHDLEGMLTGFLADFREIEDNFKEQARAIHALYLERNVSKGDVIEHALDAEELLRARDQGRSYWGFRDLARSVESREELGRLMERAGELARQHGLESPVYDNMLGRLHHEVTIVQGVYRRISTQLRRIVEERSAAEARYVRELLKEARALAFRCRDEPPEVVFMEWEEGLRLNNLMEVSFWEPPNRGAFGGIGEMAEADDEALRKSLARIGKPLNLPRFRARVDAALEDRTQVSLKELVELHPLEDGVTDLVCYLVAAAEREGSLIRPEARERYDLNRPAQPRYAEMDQVVFLRS